MRSGILLLKTGAQCIFDNQQAAQFLNRHAEGLGPCCGLALNQVTQMPAGKLLGKPGSHGQSMGAAVSLEPGVLHNIAFEQQVEADPSILSRAAGFPANDLAGAGREHLGT